jgi:hypothetical protein
MSRFETLFNLRYSERVLERSARMWAKLDVLMRSLCLLSGTSAVATLFAQHSTASLFCTIFFAALQILEYTIAPGIQSAHAAHWKKRYAHLSGKAHGMDDDALAAAFSELGAEDDTTVPEFLRRIAYNDVLMEQGCDPSHAYPESWLAVLA